MITQPMIFYFSLLNSCVTNDYVSFQLRWPTAKLLHKTLSSKFGKGSNQDFIFKVVLADLLCLAV